ncbi:MAG: hypothetical protein NTW87_12060 [Planctomycetota bacterium]|nr:hypothetical protein [Planctomycetota bacterium]
MTVDALKERFAAIGAKLDVHAPRRTSPWRPAPPFSIDVLQVGRREVFDLSIADQTREIHVRDLRPDDRHLLLLVERPESRGASRTWDTFLCGHDKRHWFVAGVPVNATTVREAKEALKPEQVRVAQVRRHVKAKALHRHGNAAFVRQGEWFFVPAPDLSPDPWLVLHKEPIRRGAGKPHIVEFLYRRGGTTVYVCPAFPNGLTENEYATLLRRQPEKRALRWQTMRRDPQAFAKGRVWHPDHKTIGLSCWHRVLLSNEHRNGVAFLD